MKINWNMKKGIHITTSEFCVLAKGFEIGNIQKEVAKNINGKAKLKIIAQK